MAIFKQGQINQVLAVCVDKTDFATVESGVTSGFTCTLYGYKQNSSAATSAVALSAAPSVVRSGIIRVKVKATETSGVDNALLKIAHASCADQYIPISFQAQDISDAISDAQSDIKSQLTAIQSDFQSRVPKLVATNSQLSDLASDLRSYLVGMSGMMSDIDSQVNVTDSRVDDLSNGPDAATIAAKVWSDYGSKVGMTASDVGSKIDKIASRVPKAAATASRLLLLESVASDTHSAATQANSRVVVMQSTLSDIDSALTSQYSDVASKIGNVAVTLTDSNISAIAAAVTSITPSDISDIASAVWANAIGARVDSRVLVNQSTVNNIYSMLSDVQSDFQSRVPKAVATNSQLTAVQSDFQSKVPKAAATASMLSDFYSDFQSRVPKAVATNSQVSDLASDLKSYMVGLSATLSDVDSALTSQYSDISSKITAETATVSNINSVLTAQIAEMAQGIPPATPTPFQALMYLYMAWRNKTETTATNLKVFNDAGTAIAQATLSDDATTFTKTEFISGA